MTKQDKRQLALIACTAVLLGVTLLAVRIWRQLKVAMEAADDPGPEG